MNRTRLSTPRARRARAQAAPRVEALEGRQLLATAVAFADGFGAPGSLSSAEAVAVDSAGNTYVTGSYTGSVNFGPYGLTSAGGHNAYVEKLDPAGNVVWAKSLGGSSGNGFGRGIGLDGAGNVYVTGIYSGSASFGSVQLNSAGGRDAFVAKLDNSGNVQWATSFGGSGDDLGQSLAVDGQGNVVTTGNFERTATFGSKALTATGAAAIYVVKQNSSGTVVWADSMGGNDTSTPSNQTGLGIALDPSGNVYTTGDFAGTAAFGGFTMTSFGDTDIFLTKMDPNGAVQYARQFGGAGHDDGVAVAVDTQGNAVVTGDFIGQATFGGFTVSSAGQDDAFAFSESPSGQTSWAKSYGGSLFDAGFGVAFDPQGGLYITGVFQGSARFGGSTLNSNGGYDVYLAKLDPASGNVGPNQSFGSTANDQSYALAVGGPANRITMTGSYNAPFNVGNNGLPANGLPASGQTNAYVIQLTQSTPTPASEPGSDFFGFGYTQVGIYRPSAGQWYALGTSTGQALGSFGAPSSTNQFDIPVAGDYDGVGRSELAVFRPSTADWFALNPNTGGHLVANFGAHNLSDIPVPGDYDGIGHTEVAVFRPSTADWFALNPSTGGHLVGNFGAPNLMDVPVPGDYDGTGHTELAVYRPSTAEWYVLGPNGGRLLATFGAPNFGDIPAPGDYDHVGHTEVAVFRPSTSQFYVLGPNGGHLLTAFGAPNLFDIPTQAPAGALVKLGLFPGGAPRSVSPQAAPLAVGISNSPTPAPSSSSATTARAAAAPRVAPLSTRSAVVVNQAAPAAADAHSTALDRLYGSNG